MDSQAQAQAQAQPQARTMITNILRKQNEALIHEIAAAYKLDPEEMKRKYLTPSLYDVYSTTQAYNVVYR